MAKKQPEWLEKVEQLTNRTDTPEIAILAEAILQLTRQSINQRQSNISAFEQIEELGRRQDEDSQSSQTRPGFD